MKPQKTVTTVIAVIGARIPFIYAAFGCDDLSRETVTVAFHTVTTVISATKTVTALLPYLCGKRLAMTAMTAMTVFCGQNLNSGLAGVRTECFQQPFEPYSLDRTESVMSVMERSEVA